MTNQPTDQKPEVTFEVNPEEASTNFYWTYGENEVFNLQTTIRGNPTSDEIEAHLRSAKMGMLEIVKMGGRAKAVGQQPAPVAKAETAPAVAPAPGSEPHNEPVAEEMVLHAVKMDVKPRAVDAGAEQRVDLQFFGENHKYADLYFPNRTIDDCIKLLKEVGDFKPEHLANTQTYSVNYRIGWVESEKLNSKGKPYKNIVWVQKA
jgi:hypothetical protein